MPSKAVLHELRFVCQSPALLKSGEAVRLLRYLVEAEQAGQAEKLREVLIGCGLYGRHAAYDPKLDAVVRVNATRLRTRLEEHYAVHPESAIRIVLPKGSYVPVYERRQVEELVPVSTVTIEDEPEAIAPTPVSHFQLHPAWHSRWSWKWLTVGAGVVCLVLAVALWWGRPQEAAGGSAWMALPFSRMGGVEQFPEFSPDGQSVVFAWAKSQTEEPHLYRQEVSSDIPQRLTGQDRAETRPAWSRDGRRLAFVHPGGDGVNHIIVRTMSNGAEVEVAATIVPHISPWLCSVPKLSWGDNGRTLYTAAALLKSGSERQGDAPPRCGIVAIDVASHSVRALTESPPVTLGDVEPSVSPDGETVAFLRTMSYGVVDVYTVSLKDGVEKRVTFDNREIMGFAWKPVNGALILAARGKDGTVRLLERDRETGASRLLTDGTAPSAFPSVAASSEQIVFTSYRSTANLYRASSGKDVELVGDQSLKAFPRLSPDGRRLAYTSDRTGFAEIWVSDADGRNGVRLTHTDGTGAQRPSWFPDGRSILFECRDLHHSQICVMPASGKGEIKRLTSWVSEQILPSLSRDGRFLYFLSNRTGKLEAYREAIEGGEPAQLTSGGAAQVVESWDGRNIYIETGRNNVGFLIVPVNHAIVDTSTLSDGNRAYVRPELHSLSKLGWNASPHGVVFCRLEGERSVLLEFDEKTGQERVLQSVHGSDTAEALSVSPDGGSVLYGSSPQRMGELVLLTAESGTKKR